VPLLKVPLQLSGRPLQVLEGCCKVSPEPSLVQAEQPQLSQPSSYSLEASRSSSLPGWARPLCSLPRQPWLAHGAGLLAFCLCSRASRALPGMAVPARGPAPHVSPRPSNAPAGPACSSPQPGLAMGPLSWARVPAGPWLGLPRCTPLPCSGWAGGTGPGWAGGTGPGCWALPCCPVGSPRCSRCPSPQGPVLLLETMSVPSAASPPTACTRFSLLDLSAAEGAVIIFLL